MAKRCISKRISYQDRNKLLEAGFGYIPRVGDVITFPDQSIATAVNVLEYNGRPYATIACEINGEASFLSANKFFWENRALRCGALASRTDLDGVKINDEDTNNKVFKTSLAALTRGEMLKELLKLEKIEVRKVVRLQLSHIDDGETILEDAKIYAYFK